MQQEGGKGRAGVKEAGKDGGRVGWRVEENWWVGRRKERVRVSGGEGRVGGRAWMGGRESRGRESRAKSILE